MTKSKKTTSIRDFHSQNINKIINTLPVNSIVNIVSLTDTATLYKGLVENYSEEKILSKMKNTYSNYSLLSAYLNKSNEQLNKEVHIFSDLQKSSFHKNQENQLDCDTNFAPKLNKIGNKGIFGEKNSENSVIKGWY